MMNMIYELSELVEFFIDDGNYAATELFNSMSNDVDFVTRKALDNMFDQGYVEIIVSNVVGKINLNS